jgi:phosphoribosylformylglycinamidine cyclo-ligase
MTQPPEPSKYSQSGVDTRAAENSLSGLLQYVLPTWGFNPRFPVRGGRGYFANVIDIGNGQGIAFCTDGVGTKMIVAELLGKYDTVGIDCVAMNVNDVICVGARPVSMVDYIGCSRADERIFAALGKGLAEGARRAGISIAGGEISQIGEIISGIDLLGACIGQVPLDRVNSGGNVKPGNLLVGLDSSGVHSNGLTLARKVLLGADREEQRKHVDQFEDELGRTVGEELLEPTRIYAAEVMEMLDSGIALNAIVHITGGGLANLNRVAAANVRFVLDKLPSPPPVFTLIQYRGEIADAEMYAVFNMGVGLCLAVEGTREAEAVAAICGRHDVPCRVIGYVEPCQGKEVLIPEKNLTLKGQKGGA